ncbi:unnamed protein product, partial [Amoebophrya sp. A25]
GGWTKKFQEKQRPRQKGDVTGESWSDRHSYTSVVDFFAPATTSTSHPRELERGINANGSGFIHFLFEVLAMLYALCQCVLMVLSLWAHDLPIELLPLSQTLLPVDDEFWTNAVLRNFNRAPRDDGMPHHGRKEVLEQE